MNIAKGKGGCITTMPRSPLALWMSLFLLSIIAGCVGFLAAAVESWLYL